MKKLTHVLLIILLSVSSYSQNNIDLKKLDNYYANMVDEWDVPGVSIGIVKDGKIIFKGNYGVKEIGKDEKPDENTLYAIASNSKGFTSTIIGMLVQEGKLDWDDKVKKHLPYFELYDSWVSNEITIRDLLCHRVGLKTYSGDIIWYKAELTSEEIIKRLKYLPCAYDFRSGYGYSNVMFITAGEIIKKVTDKSWNENVQERIFNPLGMGRTIASPDDLKIKGNHATPHALSDNINTPVPWVSWEEIGALGGIISSVSDLSKWMIFNLNNGIWDDDTLLIPETRNMLWTPHNNFIVDHTKANDFNMHFSSYGLGWRLSDYHGRLLVNHGGGYDGMSSFTALVPDENLGIIILTNGMRSPIRAAAYYALDMFLGIEPKDWSRERLVRYDSLKELDTRISDIKKSRVLGTNPSTPIENYTGIYKSDIYGKIDIILEENQLKLVFEHSRDLSARLDHWHYNVWEIIWDQPHAWFDFGTIQFILNNNLEVESISFDVPNDDFWFEELKPYKINK
jgi:CubicO group peptidase (beta-lactamase class C family)